MHRIDRDQAFPSLSSTMMSPMRMNEDLHSCVQASLLEHSDVIRLLRPSPRALACGQMMLQGYD